jgi:hypothetical protein
MLLVTRSLSPGPDLARRGPSHRSVAWLFSPVCHFLSDRVRPPPGLPSAGHQARTVAITESRPTVSGLRVAGGSPPFTWERARAALLVAVPDGLCCHLLATGCADAAVCLGCAGCHTQGCERCPAPTCGCFADASGPLSRSQGWLSLRAVKGGGGSGKLYAFSVAGTTGCSETPKTCAFDGFLAKTGLDLTPM